MKLIQLSTILLVIITLQACSGQKQSSPTLFGEPWNRTFHLRALDNEDTLSAAAIFSTSNMIYIYDQAAGTLVNLDSLGKVLSTLKLQDYGRVNYIGDDFIVRDTVATFINSVDKRLEYYSLNSGKHLKSALIPSNIFPQEKRRAYRIVNRIFLDKDRLVIGNDHQVAFFNESLEKAGQQQKIMSAPTGKRFELYSSVSPLYTNDSTISDNFGKKYHQPTTHFPIQGKKLITLKNRIFSLTLTEDSIKIVEVK